jgi:hypothetical protein
MTAEAGSGDDGPVGVVGIGTPGGDSAPTGGPPPPGGGTSMTGGTPPPAGGGVSVGGGRLDPAGGPSAGGFVLPAGGQGTGQLPQSPAYAGAAPAANRIAAVARHAHHWLFRELSFMQRLSLAS